MRKRTRVRRRFAVGIVLGIASLVGATSPAYATAIALSSISVSDLSVTSESGSITFDPFTTQAIASAQNSLGEADADVDGSPSDPATASAAVTWATASASSSGALWSAQSSVNIPGFTDGAAASQGQALWSTTFTISCTSATCDPGTTVDFDVLITRSLFVFTDGYGVFADAQTTFNLLLDGDTVLFSTSLLSIGPNDADGIGATNIPFSNSLELLYDTPYTLTLRVDAESLAQNVPEPATFTMLGLGGLIGAIRAHRARIRRR